MNKYIALIAACLAALVASCTATRRPEPQGCGMRSHPAIGAAPVPAGACASPMSPNCRGNCSPQACYCKPQRCSCAPKVAPRPAPKPRPVAVKCEPTPPKVVVAPPAPPPPPPPPAKVTVGEGWQEYYWEFKDPRNTVKVAPNQPLPPGVYPTPAQDRALMWGEYHERTVTLPTPAPTR